MLRFVACPCKVSYTPAIRKLYLRTYSEVVQDTIPQAIACTQQDNQHKIPFIPRKAGRNVRSLFLPHLSLNTQANISLFIARIRPSLYQFVYQNDCLWSRSWHLFLVAIPSRAILYSRFVCRIIQLATDCS